MKVFNILGMTLFTIFGVITFVLAIPAMVCFCIVLLVEHIFGTKQTVLKHRNFIN